MARRQVLVVITLCALFIALECVLWLLPDTFFSRWHEGLYWNYSSHILFMIIPVVALVILRRNPREYGLVPATTGKEFRIGIPIAVCLLLIPIISELTCGELRTSKNGLTFVVSTLVFQVIFSGFGEEFLYRGFIQGELNRVFQKRFVFGKVHFGWGLVITAVLFGIGHLLNPFNPFQGHFDIDISSFVFTVIMGAFLGLIREYFGGLIVVSLIHGGGNVFLTLFDTSLYGNIGYGLSYGLLCAYLGSLIFDKKVEKEK